MSGHADVRAHWGSARTSAIPRGRVLDDLAGLGPFFAVSAHPPGAAPVPPWRPVGELLKPSGPLTDRIASVRAALAARGSPGPAPDVIGGPDLIGGLDAIEPRVAASAVHLALTARLIAPALGAAVLRCPVDLRPGGLWWQDVTGGPAPLSVPAPADGASPGQAAAGLAGEWDRLLMDELVAPVTAAIAELVPVSGRVLWGNVASAVNAAAVQVARQRPDLAAEAWQAAGQLFGSRRLRAERAAPGPAFRRSSCCLFYRLALSRQQAQPNPSAICGDCVLAERKTLR